MERHTCKTYFSVAFEFAVQKNAWLLKERKACTAEELGIVNKAEVERFIIEQLGITPQWKRHHFVIGLNEEYNVDVNEMLRWTLKDLFGKEQKLLEMKNRFSLTTTLEIVPHIVVDCGEPSQILSLDSDIIAFLYKSGTAVDLDYYVE